MDRRVFNRLPPKQTRLTMREASKRSGFGVVFLKKLFGHLDGLDEASAMFRTYVRIDELSKLQAYWETF